MTASPLLLLVHGRSGGVIPSEFEGLAMELKASRGAPVELRALTAPTPPQMAAPAGSFLTLVPLFLLPGAHVRVDIPAVVLSLRQWGKVRRLPFLGAWPSWQRALAEEVAALAALAGGAVARPLLLHHPVEGAIARRYLSHLEVRCGVHCRSTPYGDAAAPPFKATERQPAVPLALAANRLTEGLGERLGVSLLARPRCRGVLLEQIGALP